MNDFSCIHHNLCIPSSILHVCFTCHSQLHLIYTGCHAVFVPNGNKTEIRPNVNIALHTHFTMWMKYRLHAQIFFIMTSEWPAIFLIWRYIFYQAYESRITNSKCKPTKPDTTYTHTHTQHTSYTHSIQPTNI